MKSDIMVLLSEAEQARTFVEVAERFHSDIDLVSGRYIVNAKSMLGVLSLVSDEPMMAQIHSEDEEEVAAFESAMREYAAP